MLFYCWADVEDVGPTLKEHWLNVSCLLGSPSALYKKPSRRPTPGCNWGKLKSRRQLTTNLFPAPRLPPSGRSREISPRSPWAGSISRETTCFHLWFTRSQSAVILTALYVGLWFFYFHVLSSRCRLASTEDVIGIKQRVLIKYLQNLCNFSECFFNWPQIGTTTLKIFCVMIPIISSRHLPGFRLN